MVFVPLSTHLVDVRVLKTLTPHNITEELQALGKSKP